MDLTTDGIFDREITVLQPSKGYRFAVDSVLLGCFAVRRCAGRALDLGSGSGIVGFILLARGGARELIGVEIDHDLAHCSCLGAQKNGFVDRYRVIEADLRCDPIVAGLCGMDLVVSNPPYHGTSTGEQSPRRGRATARHDSTLTIDDVTRVASGVLVRKGRLCVVLPPARTGEFVASAAARGFTLSRLRAVHPFRDRAARMVLLEARLGIGGPTCSIEPPLVLHDAPGKYTAEAEALLRHGRVSGGSVPRP